MLRRTRCLGWMTPIHAILVLDSLTHCPVMILWLENWPQPSWNRWFFVQYLCLHCHLSLSAPLKWLCSLLYEPRHVFASKSFLSYLRPSLTFLFQHRHLKSLKVPQCQPSQHTCCISRAVVLYLSSSVWEAFLQLTVEPCVILPLALKSHFCLGARERVTAVRIWIYSWWPISPPS